MDGVASLWNEDFRAYSPLHFLSVAACAAFVVGLCRLGVGLRRRSERAERRLRFAWAAFIAVSQVAFTVYWLLPARFNVRLSLPLHVCDIIGLLTPVALFFAARVPRALLYYWGVGLSLWGFIAPVLTAGPARSEFWVFWIGHTQIVGSAVYLLWVSRYRPTGRDAAISIGALLAYSLPMAAVNGAFGLNYGFVGPTPSGGSTPFDALGPWPRRVPIILAMEAVMMASLWAPWALARRRAASSRCGAS